MYNIYIYIYVYIMDIKNSHYNSSLLESFLPQNESQEKAKKIVSIASQLAISSKWIFKEALLLWLEWAPWLWKTHLSNSLIEQLENNNINYVSNKWDNYFLQSENYKKASVVVFDDVLRDYQKLTDVTFPSDKIFSEQFAKMIFDIYDHNKLLFITSNFGINEILQFVTNHIEWWIAWHSRLQSRINHLMANNTHIKLTWTDYREHIKNRGWAYKDLFDTLNG